MSAEQRLSRLYPALTARERGLLVLRAYKADEKPDPRIYHTCPSAQGAAFNRYIALLNAVNVELATVVLILRTQIDKTALKYSWLMTAVIWGMETHAMGRHVLAATKDRKLRKDVRRLMARAPSDVRVPLDLTVPLAEPETFEKGYGDETVKALLFGIHQDVRQHWAELRAIEIAVQEVAEEFGGKDPLKADHARDDRRLPAAVYDPARRRAAVRGDRAVGARRGRRRARTEAHREAGGRVTAGVASR